VSSAAPVPVGYAVGVSKDGEASMGATASSVGCASASGTS